jgi:PKD domain
MRRLDSWLARVKLVRSRPALAQSKSPRARARPTLEQLELRDLPALVINPIFDTTITHDPNAAKIEGTINAAIRTFEAFILDSITVNIKFQEVSSGLGQSGVESLAVPYTSYLAALKSHATTAAAKSAVASLPSGPDNPVDGNASISLTVANAVALGLAAGSAGGKIGLNTSICNLDRLAINPTKYDLLSVVAHEIDEVLGFGSVLNGLQNGSPAPTGPVKGDDLYRYNQNGARSFNTTLSTQAYFSIDGGKTRLAQFNQTGGGDFSDWFSTAAHTPKVQDAFATPGATPNLGIELTRLNVLGYTPSVLTLPLVTAPATQTAVGGASTAFNLGSFTESKPRGPWRVLVSWGDGSRNTLFFVANTGQLGARFHTYAKPGTFTAKVTITDFTSQSTSKSFTVTVSPPGAPPCGEVALLGTAGATSASATATVSEGKVIQSDTVLAALPSFQGAVAEGNATLASPAMDGGGTQAQTMRDAVLTGAVDTNQATDLLFLQPVLWS